MGQVWPFFILLIVFSSVLRAEEEYNSNRRPTTPPSQNEIQCRAFLERSQAGLVASLEAQIQEATVSRDCSNTTPLTDCAQLRELFLQDLEQYRQYRSQVGRRDITYALGEYSISGGGMGTDLRTPMREPMSGLGIDESAQIWNQFIEFQKGQITSMFAESHAGQMLYPREMLGYADSAHSECLLRNEEGQIQFEVNRERHIVTPRFVTEFPREQRDLQVGCRQLQNQYTTNRDFQRALHTTISQAYRSQDRAEGDVHGDWNADNGLAWLNYLSGSTEGKSESDLLTMASEAFNRQVSDLTTLKNRIAGLGPAEIDQLLSLDTIREEIGGSEMCNDFGQTSLREAAGVVATFLPFVNLAAIHFEGLANDQNFIAGFNSLETYNETRAGLSQAMAQAVVTDAFVGALAGEALIMGGRVASRVLARRSRARNLPDGDINPFPPVLTLNDSKIAETFSEMDEVTSRSGVRFIPDEQPGETIAMGKIESGEVSPGSLYTDDPRINRFYTPDTRILKDIHEDELGLAFTHTGYRGIVAEAEQYGYRIVVDPTALSFNYAGYVSHDLKVLALRPDADMITLRHELQHIQFDHYIRGNYSPVRSAALFRGPEQLFIRFPAQARNAYQYSPQVRNIWSRDEWRIIQRSIARDQPLNSLNEALSVHREVAALGFRRIDFRTAAEASRLGGSVQNATVTAIHAQMYANSHLIMDLRRLRSEGGLNRRQTRDLRAAENRHADLYAQYYRAIEPSSDGPVLSSARSRAALAALIASSYAGVANANPQEIAEQAREVYFHPERNAMIVVLESGEQIILGQPPAQ